MTSLAAGKHVLCEKPYTRRPDEVTEAFDAADRGGLVLMEAFMWRHTRQTKRVLELLPAIGRLQTIRATFSFPLEDQSNIRLRADLDGGSLMDVGCYCVSGARLLAGEEPAWVFATQEVGPVRRGPPVHRHPRLPEWSGRRVHLGVHDGPRGPRGDRDDRQLRLPDPWHNVKGVFYHDGEEIRRRSGQPVPGRARELRRRDPGRRASRGSAAPTPSARPATIAALYEFAETGAVVRL